MLIFFKKLYQAQQISKILLAIILLVSSYNTQAVMLRDGSTVSQAYVDLVYSALQSLNRQGKGDIICDLCHACRNGNRKMTPYFVKNHMAPQEVEGRIKIAASLFLCDEKGNIEKDIAHVISSSVSLRCVEGNKFYTYTLQSPVSWKNYFSWKYLTGEDK
jgi:hypothetical protein